MPRLALLMSIALIGAAPADHRRQSGEQALAAAIGDRQAGHEVACIDPQQVRSTRIVEGTAIVYDDGGRLYVQRPRGGGAALRRDDVLVSRIQGGQLCRGDVVTLVEPVTRAQRGFVVLGAFAVFERRR